VTYLKITNRFTGQVSVRQVQNSKAFSALNHYRSLWNNSAVRFISADEAFDLVAA
jgi:hypothetical protein